MKKAAEVLARVLDENNRKLGKNYASLFSGWSEIAGDSLGEHSRIYEVLNGSLFVEVDHPGWMQLLMMRKPKIIRSVRRRYPELQIRDLKIRVNLKYEFEGGGDADQDGRRSRGGEERSGMPEIGESESAEMNRVLAQVPDQALKLRLKRLFLKSLDKERASEASAKATDQG